MHSTAMSCSARCVALQCVVLKQCERNPVGAADYLFSKTAANFLGHTLSDTHGCYSTWLGAANLASAGVASLCQVLSHLSCLARACLTNDHQHLVVGYSVNNLVLESIDGQAFSLLLDATTVLDSICGSLQDACTQACSWARDAEA